MPNRQREVPRTRPTAGRCRHRRQVHPLHAEALLFCAWPGCEEGTARPFIQVAVERDAASSPSRVVQFERQSAFAPEGERFHWRASCR